MHGLSLCDGHNLFFAYPFKAVHAHEPASGKINLVHFIGTLPPAALELGMEMEGRMTLASVIGSLSLRLSTSYNRLRVDGSEWLSARQSAWRWVPRTHG